MIELGLFDFNHFESGRFCQLPRGIRRGRIDIEEAVRLKRLRLNSVETLRPLPSRVKSRNDKAHRVGGADVGQSESEVELVLNAIA